MTFSWGPVHRPCSCLGTVGARKEERETPKGRVQTYPSVRHFSPFLISFPCDSLTHHLMGNPEPMGTRMT